MLRLQKLCIPALFTLNLLVPLLPYIVNGAPFVGDSWSHLKIARETTTSGRYIFDAYNERWPLVNLLISFLSETTGLSEFTVGAVIPFMIGLASIPLYCLCRRLGQTPYAALVATLFLTFNPIYSYVTFSGAIMKETSAFFLVIVMLLLMTIVLKGGSFASHIIVAIITGFGIVLGHLYASLVVVLFLWAISGYELLFSLKGAQALWRRSIILASSFTFVAILWDLFNYLALRAHFPLFNLNDSMLLLASFGAIWALQAFEGKRSLARWPWLASLAFMISVFGLRGGMYILIQPVEPLGIWEAGNYLLAGGLALTGLAFIPMSSTIRAFATSSVSLVVLAYTWGFTQPGYVLLIKSLHYFSVLLALGAGFISTALTRMGIIGKASVPVLIIFLIHASWGGTCIALNGLGAYRRGELIAASSMPDIVPGMMVLGDTRAQYLMPYAADVMPSLIDVRGITTNSFILLSKPNLKQGFLFDYDWAPTRYILDESDVDSWNRVLDGEYIRALLR